MVTADFFRKHYNLSSRPLARPNGCIAIQANTRDTGLVIATVYGDVPKDAAITLLDDTAPILESPDVDYRLYRVSEPVAGLKLVHQGELIVQLHVNEPVAVPDRLIEIQKDYWDFDDSETYEVGETTSKALLKGMHGIMYVVRLAPVYRRLPLGLGRAVAREMRSAGLSRDDTYNFLFALDCAAWGNRDVKALISEVFQQPVVVGPELERFVEPELARELKQSFSEWNA